MNYEQTQIIVLLIVVGILVPYIINLRRELKKSRSDAAYWERSYRNEKRLKEFNQETSQNREEGDEL